MMQQLMYSYICTSTLLVLLFLTTQVQGHVARAHDLDSSLPPRIRRMVGRKQPPRKRIPPKLHQHKKRKQILRQSPIARLQKVMGTDGQYIDLEFVFTLYRQSQRSSRYLRMPGFLKNYGACF